MRVSHSLPSAGIGLALLATFGFAGESKAPKAKQVQQLALTQHVQVTGVVTTWDEIMARQQVMSTRGTAPVEVYAPFLDTPLIDLPALDDKAKGPAVSATTGGGVEPMVLCPSLPSEPALGANFQAQPDVPTVALTSFIPPDVAGDVGPDHVMTMLNNKVHIQDRLGGSNTNVDLIAFWGTGTNPTYPRCIYDSVSGRWLASGHVGAGVTSTILFGISDTNDPTGVWTLYSFAADGTTVTFADWVLMGCNATWVTISANMFNVAGSTFAGSKMWIIDMATALVPGGPLTISVAPTGWSGAISGFNTSGQVPTTSLDTSDPNMYVMSNPGLSAGGVVALQGFSISGTGPAPVVAALPGSPFGATAGFFLVVNNFSFNQRVMQQALDVRNITAFSSRMAAAIVRNGRVWMAHSGGLPGPATQTTLTHTASFWYEVNPAALPAPIVQSGVISSGAGSAFTMPSIAVNCGNDVVVGFSNGDVTRNPECGYTVRLGTDPLNSMGPIRLLKAGDSSYWKNFGVGTTAQWGRYSSTGIDPVDDKTFWTLQEYAAQRVGPNDNDSRWGTWWGRIGDCGAPTITDDPDPQTVCVGDPASFSVTATAFVAPLAYQWRKDGFPISGETASTFSIPSTIGTDGGTYDVVVYDGCGSATSVGALLDFSGAVVNVQPQNQSLPKGGTANFSVTASGTGTLTYAWRKDGALMIPAETNSTLTITGVGKGDIGVYDCIVSDMCGPTLSDPAVLMIEPGAAVKPYLNDVIELEIYKQPESGTLCVGNNEFLQVKAVGHSPTYVWRKNTIPIVPPETNDTLLFMPVDASDGGSYDCVVTDATGVLISDSAVITVHDRPTITAQPMNVNAHIGDDASFSVSATGDAILTYQWRKGGAIGPLFNIPGSNGTTHDVINIQQSDFGRYQCAVTNWCGTRLSNAARLSQIL